MYSDFIFVGPSHDNLRLRQMDTIDVLHTIYGSKVIFLSRSIMVAPTIKKKIMESAGLEPKIFWAMVSRTVRYGGNFE